jgi:hypothetical protein
MVFVIALLFGRRDRDEALAQSEATVIGSRHNMVLQYVFMVCKGWNRQLISKIWFIQKYL